MVPPILEPRCHETEYLVSVGVPQSELRSSRAPSTRWHSISFPSGPFCAASRNLPQAEPRKTATPGLPNRKEGGRSAQAHSPKGGLVSTSRAVFSPGGGAKSLRGRGVHRPGGVSWAFPWVWPLVPESVSGEEGRCRDSEGREVPSAVEGRAVCAPLPDPDVGGESHPAGVGGPCGPRKCGRGLWLNPRQLWRRRRPGQVSETRGGAGTGTGVALPWPPARPLLPASFW